MEGFERCTLSPSIDGHWSHGSIFLLMKLLQKKVNFGHAIPFSISRDTIEGCERCTRSPSFDGHWSHISILLLTKVITNRKLI